LALLKIQPGHRILDLACGNGQFARKIASLGALVTATDFSEQMIRIAQSKSGENIVYRVVDVTRDSDLAGLGANRYDSAVCTMAIMDIETIEPLASHLPKLLYRGGAFVFSILHPCFNSLDTILCAERDEPDGNLRDRYGVRIYDYLLERSGLGIAMAGQPEKQYYFHRPISVILHTFFQQGFVLDALEEPSFKDISSARLFDNVYRNIPAALLCRLRLL
jgi:ubiquinone/menaquinone biosynthesis C-methylase UbiE